MEVTGDAKQIVYTHGTWRGMLERCYRTTHRSYKDYGGRGISVCDSWRESFENFLKDMGVKPSKTSLERIDVNGNYEPSNCCWANAKTQAQNTRVSISITWNGITKNASEWAREFNLGVATFHQRYKSGMPMDQIRDTPILGTSKERGRNRRNAVMLTYNGKTQCMSAWADELGTTVSTLWRRKNDGWSDEKIITTPIAKYREEVLITYNGKTQNQDTWAKELGISGHAISNRRKQGYSIDEILSTAPLPKGGSVGELFEFRGEQKTVAEIAKELNIHTSLVSRRIKDGVRPDDMKPRKVNYVREIKLTYNGKTQNISQWSRELGITEAKIQWGLSQKWSLDKILQHKE